MVKPINPALRARLEQLAALAPRRGGNLWDLLNEAGLLYTNDRRAAERAAALLKAINDLEALSVPQIMGPSYRNATFTAADMRRGLMHHLHLITAQEQEGRR